jgi:hypothetical protein
MSDHVHILSPHDPVLTSKDLLHVAIKCSSVSRATISGSDIVVAGSDLPVALSQHILLDSALEHVILEGDQGGSSVHGGLLGRKLDVELNDVVLENGHGQLVSDLQILVSRVLVQHRSVLHLPNNGRLGITIRLLRPL